MINIDQSQQNGHQHEPVSKMVNEVNSLKNLLQGGPYDQIQGWDIFEKKLESLDFNITEPDLYLASLSKMYGSSVIVRRAKMEPVFTMLETGEPLHVRRYDTEPNAAILGSLHGENKISGIEASMNGGFDWLIDGKVAAVFGFLPDQESLTVSNLAADSPSLTKMYGETMRGIEGDISKKDMLFILLRIHKSVYPDELCEDEDFDHIKDEVTGKLVAVRKPFVLRLYKKNRQTH